MQVNKLQTEIINKAVDTYIDSEQLLERAKNENDGEDPRGPLGGGRDH